MPVCTDTRRSQRTDLYTRGRRHIARGRRDTEYGGRAGFWGLWERHEADLFRLCLAFEGGRRADAEDAFGTARLKAFLAYQSQTEAIRHPGGWLTCITRNTCLDLRRRRAVQSERVVCLGDVEDRPGLLLRCPLPTPEECVSGWAPVLSAVLRELPPPLSTACELRFCEGLSYDAIADRLGLTPANVRKRIQLARSLLRSMSLMTDIGA